MRSLWTVGMVAALLAVLTLAFAWKAFQWSECRMVGHSKLYCVLDMGRK